MLHTQGRFCACGEELKTEKEKNYGACYGCLYQENGDFNNFPHPPQFEPMFPLDEPHE